MLGKQLATYYAQILFYAFLTDTPVSSLEDLIASIGQCANNKRIARNVGLQASILQIIQTESNPFVLRALDYKIANINTLMSDTSLTPSERVAVAMKKFGRLSSSEIVTPQAVALEMIDALDEGVITRDTRILDIASKQGEFTRALVSRFGMAVGRNVYALPTSTVSYEFTLKVYRLLGLDTDHVISDFTTYDLIDPNKKDQLMEQLKEMNLNFTIGNPPYQAQTDNSRTKPIYDLFIDLSMDITHRVSLITPARYLFNAGFTSKKWNKKMLGSENLKVSIYKANSVTVFPNVDIKGGVAAIYYDKNRNFGGIGDFKAYEELDSISEKVNSASEPSLVDIIYAESSYRFDTNKEFVQQLVSERLGNDKKVISNVFEKLPDLFTEVQGKGRIGFYGRLGSDRCIRYIERKYIEDHPNLEKYKVFVPESNGSGAIGEVLSTPLIGEPLIGGTQTFLSIGAFDSRSEAEACLKYIKTKFARTMLGILKATQHNPKDTWRLVPLQDFTAGSDIDWSQSVADIDRQLYKKYALTPDEIAFIEEKVSPMV